MEINSIKTDTLDIMARTYRVVHLKKIDQTFSIEKAGFLLNEHADAIKEECKSSDLQVSFRVAGKDTLDCIRKGNPCKGHTILDKTIKQKNGQWTYSCTTHKIEDFKGLVGKSKKGTDSILEKIWGLDKQGKEICYSLDDAKKNLTSCFTGDYDMHDLLKNNKRILSGTPDEASTINKLLFKMENSSLTIKEKVNGRRFNSPYAWIRHGAQTSFISYLLLGKNKRELKNLSRNIEELPLQGKVTTIDNNIIMFDNKGDVYLLDSLDKVYSYYHNNNLLEQIPFYFFFDDLIKKGNTNVKEFASQINNLLK